MKINEISIFLMDLGNMLSSGMSLVPSLRILEETSQSVDIRLVCSRAIVSIEQGACLSEALAASKGIPSEVQSALRSGEKAGQLPMVLAMLSSYLDKTADMRQKALTALAYPAVVMTILLAVFMYMSVDVVPKLSVLLPSYALQGFLTGSMIASAIFLKTHWPVLLVVVLVIAGGIIALKLLRQDLYRAVCRSLPLAGPLMKERELALGFFTLYVLQKSGVVLDAALVEAANVAGGSSRTSFESCRAYLAGGLTLSEAARRDSHFPRFVADTLRVGEESGRFEVYFERLYKIFYGSFEARMERLSGAVRPALLLVCAGFIMLIALGFLQPLYANLTNFGN